MIGLSGLNFYQVAFLSSFLAGSRLGMEKRHNPDSYLKTHLMQLPDHFFGVRKFNWIEFQVAVLSLPAVINLQHVIWITVRLDLSGKLEN